MRRAPALFRQRSAASSPDTAIAVHGNDGVYLITRGAADGDRSATAESVWAGSTKVGKRTPPLASAVMVVIIPM